MSEFCEVSESALREKIRKILQILHFQKCILAHSEIYVSNLLSAVAVKQMAAMNTEIGKIGRRCTPFGRNFGNGKNNCLP